MPLDQVGTDVRGHDDNRIAEINLVPFGVGQVPFFHNLQQELQGFRVCLFDLIEDYDAIRLAADGFRQLTGFFVANISGRRPHQAADGVAFHKFRHVNLDQGLFAAKHEACQGFGQLRLAYTCWTQEHE